MGEFVDKVKGSANEVIGKVKQKSSDPETRQEGVAQEVKGKAQKLAGTVKGAMGDDI
ncbi:MAG: CsbD family protein [Sphingobium sp. 32-64-5]|nr:MAG: CsbD family protein [Sphingobium sp. 32-64-5]